ncbi:MAG: thiamine phosphate synthase, partial [Kiritimatiellaeota bacterium]|nr:thiamine phosphate synthase [Kiritimatiellota bacterium]
MTIGLYLVLTSPVAGYRACAEAAVKAGVRLVQLRMKGATAAEIEKTGREIRAITQGTPTRFILNDDPEMAERIGADGVHVGQDDITVAEVRRRFPSLGIVGLSTHSMAQMRAAEAAREDARPPDYIGIGPVFPTPTKPDYGSLGLATAAAIATATSLPYVAIGGIDEMFETNRGQGFTAPKTEAAWQEAKKTILAWKKADTGLLTTLKEWDQTRVLDPNTLVADLQGFRGDHYALASRLGTMLAA